MSPGSPAGVDDGVARLVVTPIVGFAVPNLAGWRRERFAPSPTSTYIDTPPDWICEVLSPSTQAIDRTDKLTVYAEFGVKHCWYVDPIARTLEVLELTGGSLESVRSGPGPDAKWLLAATFKDDGSVTAPPFEAHTFALDVLWVPDAG